MTEISFLFGNNFSGRVFCIYNSLPTTISACVVVYIFEMIFLILSQFNTEYQILVDFLFSENSNTDLGWPHSFISEPRSKCQRLPDLVV